MRFFNFLKGLIIGIVVFMIIVFSIIIIKNIPKIFAEMFKEEQYYYECIDTFGNDVICEKIYNSYGQLWGIMEDGTAVQISKGKKIIVED